MIPLQSLIYELGRVFHLHFSENYMAQVPHSIILYKFGNWFQVHTYVQYYTIHDIRTKSKNITIQYTVRQSTHTDLDLHLWNRLAFNRIVLLQSKSVTPKYVVCVCLQLEKCNSRPLTTLNIDIIFISLHDSSVLKWVYCGRHTEVNLSSFTSIKYRVQLRVLDRP